jgi:hypothetical protein
MKESSMAASPTQDQVIHAVPPPPVPPFAATRQAPEITDEERAARRAAQAAEHAANNAALADLVRNLPDNVLAALLREVAKVPLQRALWAMGR